MWIVTFICIKATSSVFIWITDYCCLDKIYQTYITNLFVKSNIITCFLFLFRTPDPDTVLIIHTPQGVFTSKKLLQKNGKSNASRKIRKDIPQDSPLPTHHFETSSAARCLIYNKIGTKVCYAHTLIRIWYSLMYHDITFISVNNVHICTADELFCIVGASYPFFHL